MRRRALFALCGAIVVAGIVAAILVFPTRYRCNGDDLSFTTSRSFAERTCVTGVTGDVVADHRPAPRGAVLAIVVMSAAWLLRLATEDPREQAVDE